MELHERHGKTSPAQRRINRILSVATLSRVLQLNFPHGTRLIVLAYASDGYTPVGAYAEQDIKDWLRRSRKQLGGSFRYVRATQQECTIVHSVVTELQRAQAESIAAVWEYGPAWVEEIAAEQLPALAEQFAGKAERHRRSWITSKGLKRSE